MIYDDRAYTLIELRLLEQQEAAALNGRIDHAKRQHTAQRAMVLASLMHAERSDPHDRTDR